MPVAARGRGPAGRDALPSYSEEDEFKLGSSGARRGAQRRAGRLSACIREHARCVASTVAVVALLAAWYLRAWAFEGLVRVATNGRLDELRFFSPHALHCPPRPDALPGAYVTVLGTPDYLPGVRVLAHALRRAGAAFPLVVLIPEDLPVGVEQPLLDDAAAHGGGPNGSFAVTAERVQRLFYAPELEQSLNKLWAFSLTRFALVVYLDADVLPLAAPDELFALLGAQRRALRVGPPQAGGTGRPATAQLHAHARSVHTPLFAAAPDWGRHGGDAPGFNAGVFAATPCEGLLEELLSLAASPEHAHDARCHRRGTADQPLLQYYFGLDTFGLPLRYNMLQPGLAARPRLGDAYPPVVLHFTKLKPWEAVGDAAASQQPGMADWAAVCDELRCCEAAGACGPRRDARPRGPHFRRQTAERTHAAARHARLI